MKQLLVAVAVVSLATTGCVNTSQFARKNSGPARQMVQSQSASASGGVRTVSFNSLLGKKKHKKCEPGCCCDECCSECTCGYPEDCCCDASCGCEDSCCECSCGCPQEDCCDAGCGCTDECCECTCGCPQEGCCDDCCECSCGCPEEGCCDASCGCTGGCCSCGNGNGGWGNGCDGYGNGGLSPCQRVVGQVASGFCPHSSGYPEMYNFNPGPPVGQTAYPYYTTRGPRDFLQNNPPTIGPY